MKIFWAVIDRKKWRTPFGFMIMVQGWAEIKFELKKIQLAESFQLID